MRRAYEKFSVDKTAAIGNKQLNMANTLPLDMCACSTRAINKRFMKFCPPILNFCKIFPFQKNLLYDNNNVCGIDCSTGFFCFQIGNYNYNVVIIYSHFLDLFSTAIMRVHAWWTKIGLPCMIGMRKPGLDAQELQSILLLDIVL